ncbi:hypothetical protein EPN44_13190 [bacterium]|nr:MAG: hypothetical protein EPN44_13190 [bacterium]
MRRLLVPTHRPPVHPGEILVEEYLKPLNVSQTDFAKRIGVTFHCLNENLARYSESWAGSAGGAEGAGGSHQTAVEPAA